MKEHNMKRTIVLLATLLLSFGLVSANEVALDVQVNGTSTPDTIWSLQPVKVFINATATEPLGGASLGVEISTGDAATWTWDAVKVDTMGWAGQFGLTGCLVPSMTQTAFCRICCLLVVLQSPRFLPELTGMPIRVLLVRTMRLE
jgi:hypothetical protein